jgi:hypothetical protein
MYTLLFGLDPILAIGTSLTTSIFTAGSASLCHARERTIQYPVVMLLIVGSVPSVIIASCLIQFLPGTFLTIFFSLFLFFIAIRMIVSGLFVSRDLSNNITPAFLHSYGNTCKNIRNRCKLILCGIAGGLASGFSGISAGTIFVPVLFRSGFSMKCAVAASLAAIVVISSGAAFMNILLNHVSFPFLLFSALGVTIGAIIGVRLSYNLRSATIQYGFSITLIFIAFLMLNNAFN